MLRFPTLRKYWMYCSCILLCCLLLTNAGLAHAAEKAAAPTKEESYAAALTLLETNDLYSAEDAFTALKTFEESKTYLAYTKARILVKQHNFEAAFHAFEALGDFLDSRENAAALADMRLIPFTDSGALTALLTAGEEIKEDSIEKFSATALKERIDRETFYYGLMDSQGNQKTRLEWTWIGGLANSLGMKSNPFEENYYLNSEYEHGTALFSHHVPVYLVHNGNPMVFEQPQYGYPHPREAEYYNGYGLMNAQGEILVKPEYGALGWTAYGMAVLASPYSETVHLFCLTEGAAPYEPLGEWDAVLPPLEDGLFAARKGNSWQYIGRDGQALGDRYDEIRTHQAGYGAVQRNGKWGLVDKNAELVLPCEYDEVLDVYNGLSAVQESNAWRYIHPDGTPAFEGTFSHADEFRDGLSPVQTTEGLFGFVNVKGEMVIEAKYTEAGRFHEDVHFAPVALNGKWGIVDRNGKEIIKPKYESILTIPNLALSIVTEKGKYGLINRTGKVIVKPSWSNIGIDHSFQLLARSTKDRLSMLGINGKAIIAYNPKYKDRSSFNISRYPGGNSAMYLNFSWGSHYWVDYYDAKGKKLKITLDLALESAAADSPYAIGDMSWQEVDFLPRPVSAQAPALAVEEYILTGGANIQDVSLFPFLPEQTIGDLQAGRVPEDWIDRLTFEQEDGWVLKDSLSGMSAHFFHPFYDIYGSGDLIGFREQAISLSSTDYPRRFVIKRTNYSSAPSYEASYHNEKTNAFRSLRGENEAFFYEMLLSTAAEKEKSETLLEILTPLAQPSLDFMAKELSAGRRYGQNNHLLITEGETWEEIPLFPFSASYTAGDFAAGAADPTDLAGRLTFSGTHAAASDPEYFDEATGVSIHFSEGDALGEDSPLHGYATIGIRLPTGVEYSITSNDSYVSKEAQSPENAGLYIDGRYYIREEWREEGDRYYSVSYAALTPQDFYTALLEDVRTLGEDALPLCETVEIYLLRAQEAQAASGLPQAESLVKTWPKNETMRSPTVSVTDSWLLPTAKGPGTTWEDICMVPLSPHTIGEALLAGSAEKKLPWHTALNIYETTENGQITDLYLSVNSDIQNAYHGVSFYDPVYNEEETLVGFAYVNIHTAAALDFTIEGTADKGVVYFMGADEVSPEDFYALLWNTLLMDGENARPMLESLNRVLLQSHP